MCMFVAAKYIQIHSDMHMTTCAYLYHRGTNVCKPWSKFTQVYTGLLSVNFFHFF